jgi:hypothetical protein
MAASSLKSKGCRYSAFYISADLLQIKDEMFVVINCLKDYALLYVIPIDIALEIVR